MKTLVPHFAVLLLSPLASAQDILWDEQFGTPAEDSVGGVASDGTGGMYVAGATSGDLAGMSAGLPDPWLARYDAAGNEMWSRQFGFGFNHFEAAEFAAEDDSGGAFVGGARCDQQCSSTSAWIAQYDDAGNEQWNVIALSQGGSNHGARAGAPDRSGGVFVGGNTEGNVGGPNAGGSDAWFARFDSSGSRQWIRQFGSANFDSVAGAASDASGSLYLCGLFGWTGGPVGEGWFGRYDGNGDEQWRVTFATGGYSSATSICTDGAGGVYVCGFTTAALNGQSPTGGTDSFVTRYDGAGNEIWTRVFGVASGDQAESVAPSPAGGVFVTGTKRANTSGFFHDDAWLARFDASGNELWNQTIATDLDDTVGGVAWDGLGGVLFGCTTRGVLGASNAGLDDVWIARFDDSIGDRYCSPAVPNSTGAPGVLIAVGSASVSQNNVELVGSSLPAGSFGLFLTSRTQGLVMNAGGSVGNLCLGGAIGRYIGPGQVQNSGSAGQIRLVLDLTRTPTPTGLEAIQAGETWSFTAWHRDSIGGAATSNFTDAVAIDFL